MNQFEIVAQQRSDYGKGASRNLRRTGKVPAIVYGAGKDPVAVQMEHNDLMHQLEVEAFYSHILILDLDGSREQVVLKDLQRHPYKPQILHLDLLRIDEHERIEMRIPIHFLNSEQCVGVKRDGGVISHLMTHLDIVCLPKDLPEYIAVDLLEVTLGQTIHLDELVIPENVQIHALVHGGDPKQPVVSVHGQRTTEDFDEGAEVEGESGAEGGESEE